MVEVNNIYNMDCLDGIKMIDSNSVDLIVIDPPYNINKAEWDSWKTIEDYVHFMGKVFTECQRVLKDNGSFYFFHNDFEQMAELQHWIRKNTKFIFKSLITWDKLTYADTVQIGSLAKGYGKLRNYFSGSTSEYCVFYTLTDENLNSNYPICREYSKKLYDYIGLPKKKLIEDIGHKIDHCFRFNSTQWSIPTEQTYEAMINLYHINEMDEFMKYQQFADTYNQERYTFNKPNIKIQGAKLDELKNNLRNSTTVWDFDRPKSNYKIGHLTPKPVKMIEHIIKTSSLEDDVVLDCFMGSGTTAIACMNTGRNYIGFELDENYHNAAQNRINEHKSSILLE